MACTNCYKCIFNYKINRAYRYLNFVRHKSEGTKVVLLNSYSKVGIFTAYLLKKTNLFTEICLHEPRNVEAIDGVVADLNKINTPPLVTFQKGRASIFNALENANIVVMLEKSVRIQVPTDKYGCRTEVDIATAILKEAFERNALRCAQFAESYARICPSAFLIVAMKPINSTLPLVCKVAGNLNHVVSANKIFGFMSLDVITANLIWARNAKMKIENVKVPIVGGSSTNTTIPIFSQMKSPDECDDTAGKALSDLLTTLTERLRKINGAMLLNPKAPLATSAAIAKFVISIGTAVKGTELTEYAYIKSKLLPSVTYLAGPLQLGPGGVQQILPIPNLSDYEKLLFDSIPYYLTKDIKQGEDFAENYLKSIECDSNYFLVK